MPDPTPKPTEHEPMDAKTPKGRQRRLLYFNIVRNATLKLRMRVHPDIENFYKTHQGSRPINTSQSWKDSEAAPLKYYDRQFDRLLGDRTLSALIEHYFDSYGGDLLNSEGGINLALLRTVGLSDHIVEIVVPQQYTEDTLRRMGEAYQTFVIALYKSYIRPVRIRCDLFISEVF